MYDGSGEIDLPYLGEVRRFAFRNGELFKLQESFGGVSPMRIRREIAMQEPSNLAWVGKVIELGLVGGGHSVAEAKALTENRIGTGKEVPWIEAMNTAALILTAALCGPVSDTGDDDGDEDADGESGGNGGGLETGQTHPSA